MMSSSRPPGNPDTLTEHGEALPPDVLAAKVTALATPLFAKEVDAAFLRALPQIVEGVETAMERKIADLLNRYTQHLQETRVLPDIPDIARTLGISVRTVEKLVADGELPVLWIRGQRRVHPDALDAYLRRSDRPKGRKVRRRAEA